MPVCIYKNVHGAFKKTTIEGTGDGGLTLKVPILTKMEILTL